MTAALEGTRGVDLRESIARAREGTERVLEIVRDLKMLSRVHEEPLETLYVQAHFLRQGVGSLLLAAAEALARRRVNRRLWLTVNATNCRAIAFYDRKGYTKIGTAYFVLGTARYENHVLAGPDV